MDDEDAAFYIVRDNAERIPDEHYCSEHLIGEDAYLAKHRLKDSGDIEIIHIYPEEVEDAAEDFGELVCDDAECALAEPHGVVGELIVTPQ